MYKKINLIIMKLLESVLVPCNLAKHNLAYSRDSKHTFSQTHFLPLLPPPHRQRRLHSSLLPTQHLEALNPRIIARPGANRIFLALHRRKCRRVHGYGGLDTRSASWNVSRSWDAEWQTSRTYRSWQFAKKTKSAQSGQSLKHWRMDLHTI